MARILVKTTFSKVVQEIVITEHEHETWPYYFEHPDFKVSFLSSIIDLLLFFTTPSLQLQLRVRQEADRLGTAGCKQTTRQRSEIHIKPLTMIVKCSVFITLESWSSNTMILISTNKSTVSRWSRPMRGFHSAPELLGIIIRYIISFHRLSANINITNYISLEYYYVVWADNGWQRNKGGLSALDYATHSLVVQIVYFILVWDFTASSEIPNGKNSVIPISVDLSTPTNTC